MALRSHSQAWKDPIIEEIRQIRFDIEAECDNDFDKIFAEAARIQKTLTNQVVSKPGSSSQKNSTTMAIKLLRGPRVSIKTI